MGKARVAGVCAAFRLLGVTSGSDWVSYRGRWGRDSFKAHPSGLPTHPPTTHRTSTSNGVGPGTPQLDQPLYRVDLGGATGKRQMGPLTHGEVPQKGRSLALRLRPSSPVRRGRRTPAVRLAGGGELGGHHGTHHAGVLEWTKRRGRSRARWARWDQFRQVICGGCHDGFQHLRIRIQLIQLSQ